MKKLIVCLLLIAMIVLCFSGCRKDKDEAKSESVSETDMASSAENTEDNAQAQDGAENQKDEEASAAQSQETKEEDEPLIIVPEGEMVGGDDLD